MKMIGIEIVTNDMAKVPMNARQVCLPTETLGYAQNKTLKMEMIFFIFITA